MDFIKEYIDFAVLGIILLLEILRSRRDARIDNSLGELEKFLDNLAVVNIITEPLKETDTE